MESTSHFEDVSKQKWTLLCNSKGLYIDFGGQALHTSLQTSHISQRAWRYLHCIRDGQVSLGKTCQSWNKFQAWKKLGCFLPHTFLARVWFQVLIQSSEFLGRSLVGWPGAGSHRAQLGPEPELQRVFGSRSISGWQLCKHLEQTHLRKCSTPSGCPGKLSDFEKAAKVLGWCPCHRSLQQRSAGWSPSSWSHSISL